MAFDVSSITSMIGGSGGSSGGGGGSSAGGNAMSISGMAEQDIANYLGSYLATQQEDTAIHKGMDALTTSYNKATGELQPYQAVGQMGVKRLSGIGDFSFNPQDLQNEPGYQFQLQQGQAGVNASAFAKGLGTSGATAQAMSYFNQQLAGTSYQNAYNRALSSFNTNAGLGEWETQLGQGNSNALANLDTGYGENMTNLNLQLGNVHAAGIKGAQSAADEQGAHLQQIGQMKLGDTSNQQGSPAAQTSSGSSQPLGYSSSSGGTGVTGLSLSNLSSYQYNPSAYGGGYGQGGNP